MRKMGWQEPVDIDTVWGGKFSGMLPEAVTTVIWRFGFFDLFVSLTLLKYLKPGSQFLDIGAHFGYFSLFASHLVGEEGKVLSIEAMPSTFSFLKSNIEKNSSFDNVDLHQGAAFNEKTELEFTDYGLVASSLNSAFGSRVDNSLSRGKGPPVTVQAEPIDEIAARHGMNNISLVKIDAESSEKFVIMGMTETLKQQRPVLITEVGDIGVEGGIMSSDQIDLLKPLGYTPHKWTDDFRLLPFEADGPLEYANLVFIPD